MRLTQKIKSAISILEDAEKEGEKCEHNYIHFNRSKYFVFKNNLYKSQKYIKPAGTIKNGRIVLKGHKSIETLKSVQRKIKRKTNKNTKFELPESPMPESEPFGFSNPQSEPEKSKPVTPPESEPFGFSNPEPEKVEPETVEKPEKLEESKPEKTEVFEEPEKTEVFEEPEKTEVFEEPEKTELFEEPEKTEVFEEPKQVKPENRTSTNGLNKIKMNKNMNKMS
jgi:hypothetical protein